MNSGDFFSGDFFYEIILEQMKNFNMSINRKYHYHMKIIKIHQFLC
jgi:hypothetical protein